MRTNLPGNVAFNVHDYNLPLDKYSESSIVVKEVPWPDIIEYKYAIGPTGYLEVNIAKLRINARKEEANRTALLEPTDPINKIQQSKTANEMQPNPSMYLHVFIVTRICQWIIVDFKPDCWEEPAPEHNINPLTHSQLIAENYIRRLSHKLVVQAR